MKRSIVVAVVVVAVAVVIAVGGGIFAYTRYFGPQSVMQTNPDSAHCRQGDIFKGVDRQARFTVLSTCERTVGVVHDMKGTKEDDGDYQFNLQVEEPYNKLLNSENAKQVSGMLVVEIIPQDQGLPVGADDVQIPKNGDRIEVYGAWVTDNPHGWNEIHPAWRVKILGSGASS
ncbi:MAG: hypothetical protein C4292_01955 [Nitrososphaera sp.]